MIPNDFLLYSEAIAYSRYHQGGFTKQLLETAAKTHNQTLGEHSGIPWIRGKKDYGIQWCQEHQGETHRVN